MTQYEYNCKTCNKKMYSAFEVQLERTAEEHMMETGHIVEIKEA